ncbi:MAG: DUF2235 domain-containing protein [Xanthomonadaceae bacterium]|nr:DUF2235 domain-containing protein [Xanthomonadaceae bacterium]MDE1964167.1 DUF2235 domain-containing protein [Xanthomonadaceae bacterium]
MAEKHHLEKDGVLSDGVGFRPASEQAKSQYYGDIQQDGLFEVPVLMQSKNPHSRLFVACMDGTGNDAIDDPEHETNVGRIADQIARREAQGDTRIAAGYVQGPGTQEGLLRRTLDGIDGFTSEERAERMYQMFIEQARTWKREDPKADISLVGIGFSRGGDEIAVLSRLVHERGIQDPSGAVYTYDVHHQIKQVQYIKPPLVPPGKVAQAVGLFDPVGTGNELRNDDRRLSPSVISGVQLTATDEHRGLFKSDRIIDPGISDDGRFAGMYVPGAHSDVGGGYHRDGLSIRAGNLMIDYLNCLSDEPFLNKSIEPDDPRLNVVHRSEEGMFIYRITGKVNRLLPEGYNELLVPRHDIDKVADPYNAEPVDKSMRESHLLRPFRACVAQQSVRGAADGDERVLSQQIDQMLAAARAGDWSGFMQGNERFAEMNEGQALRADARAVADAQTQLTPPRMPDTPALSTQGWQR